MIISNKTISVNLDKFESNQSNNLLIIGLIGSGKTTLANYLAKKYNTKIQLLMIVYVGILKITLPQMIK